MSSEKYYLAHWMSGNLSDDELRNIVGDDEFKRLNKLRNVIASVEPDGPDLEANFSAVKQKLAEVPLKKPKVVRFYYYAAAAVLLICFGIYQVFWFSNEISTGTEITSVWMKDGSNVKVGPSSQIQFPEYFRYNRSIKLDGEAVFDVKKGSTFSVCTDVGNITVLGTRFRVVSRPDFFEVYCYEGKVRVKTGDGTHILTANSGVRSIYNEVENTAHETRQDFKGESKYESAPVSLVMTDIQARTGVAIDYPKEIGNLKFSGTLTMRDVSKALQSVCIPLHLQFKVQDGRYVVYQ